MVALALCAALTLTLACKAQFLDPGPNPAKIQVQLKANYTADPNSRIIKKYMEPVEWDWGLYKVTNGGVLPALPTADKQQLKGIEGDSLTRDTVFLAPGGKGRYRLIVEAYKTIATNNAMNTVGLGSFQRDFDLNLAPGQTTTLKVNLP